ACPAEGGARKPADQEERRARHAEGHDTIAPGRRRARNRGERGFARRNGLGAFRRDDLRRQRLRRRCGGGRVDLDDASAERSAVFAFVAHRKRAPSRNSSARSRVICAMPSTGEGAMAGGANAGTLRKGDPQAPARGGRIGTLPTKNFDCLLLPTGRPTTTCTRWPSISWLSSAVEITDASAVTSSCALLLLTSSAGNAAMLRNNAARWSRWMSGTWSAFVAANKTLSMRGPKTSLERIPPWP